MINIINNIGPLLLEVEKPCRYTGGEYGRLAKPDAPLQTLIAFPDLYEIGMSNQALRIIYNGLNRLPGISCDRAFAPAPDFEQLLRDQNLPLYGLDTGISLKKLDLLLFTLGYELGISGILAMLDVSGIPLHSDQRSDDDPIVIAGGPAVSNPLPYSSFIDAFWIGEAEAGFFDLAQELLEIKNAGGGRSAMFDRITKHANIWMKGKEKAVRAVAPFAEASSAPPAVFPIPSMKIVQHHGILEIMRGCPNGCRFCHAGYWYRPMRQKSHEALVREAEAFISMGGYREISLSSLSTGDYAGIDELVDALNEKFSGRHVSFQLPSLRVSTFSLPLLEKVSQTRKSGLTFAVETPHDFWQLALNKQVTADSVVEILREAKRNGWKGAKFYFMIGLPLPELVSHSMTDQISEEFSPSSSGIRQVKTFNAQLADNDTIPHSPFPIPYSEETEIVNFIAAISKRTGMHFNINVGIFVPKPHTPYQWAQQIDRETAAAKLEFIRSRLKPLGHKVSVSDTLVSTLEGILSRGDERAGALAEAAFRAGSRLDAWQEFIAKDVWQNIIDNNSRLSGEFLSAKETNAPLPWNSVTSGVSPAYLLKELEKSNRGELTPVCADPCPAPCGNCNDNIAVIRNSTTAYYSLLSSPPPDTEQQHCSLLTAHCLLPPDNDPVPYSLFPVPCSSPDPSIYRMLFSFTKEGSAVFHGHLNIIEIFSMALSRAGIDVLYTQGFNPLAKLEIVSPLSIGISASAEIAAVDFLHEFSPSEFMEKLNAALPDGIQVNRAEIYHIPAGSKKHSLSSLLWGFGYSDAGGITYIPSLEEKAYRAQRLSSGGTNFSLRRACVLAKTSMTNNAEPWASYFDVYTDLYKK